MSKLARTLLLALAALLLAAPAPAEETVLTTIKEKARALYKAGDLDGSLQHANAALRMKVREREMTLLKAEILIRKKRPREAIRLLEPIVVREPENREALRLLLQARPPKQPDDFEWNRRLALLRKKYKRHLVSERVLTAADYHRLAEEAAAESVFGRAVRMAAEAIRLDPRNDARHVYLASLYEKAGEFDSAARVYDALDRLRPGSFEVLLAAGELYRKANQLEVALARFQAAEKLKGDDERVIMRILDTSRALGMHGLYSTYLERKVGTLLTDPKYLRERATAYIRRGEWALAKKDLEAWLPKEGDDGTRYLIALVDLLARGGGPFKFTERPVELSSLVRSDFKELFRASSGENIPDLAKGPDAKKALARLYWKIGYVPDALRLLQTVGDEERDPECYYVMAQIHEAQGDKEANERSLDQAKFVDSAFLPARLDLARLYHGRGGFEQANTELDAVLKIEPNNFRGLLQLARLQYDIGQAAALEATIKKLKKIDPGSADLKTLLEEIAAPPAPAPAPAE